MSARIYRVISVSVERNLRGVEMRRVKLAALDGEAFQSGDANTPPAPAVGEISELVTPAEAEKLQPGAMFSVTFRPHVAEA